MTQVADKNSENSNQLIRLNAGSAGNEKDHKRVSSQTHLPSGFRDVSSKERFTVAVLCAINLINYMDRFTIAGVLPDIQKSLGIKDDRGGLLQTVFIVSYMIFAPIFGYLGDRFSRKTVMAFGVALWGSGTLLGSYTQTFGWFIAFRALVGIGETCYSTIAPTILSDLFIGDLRSKMLAIFYFAIPVGSGLGYIVGSEAAKAFGSWHWALRVTPALVLISVVLLCFIHEPERGQSEGSAHMETTSYVEDVKDVCKNKSFMLSTAGFTCVAFVAGAFAWFLPKFMHLGLKAHPGNENIQLSDVSFIVGAITMSAGILGVPLGSYLSTKLSKTHPRSDPVICAVGLLLSAPLVAGSMLLIKVNSILAYILMFLGQLTLNCNWSIVADMLLYVVVPTRRSTAEAFQILISHALGDAFSPYLVGVISEAIKPQLREAENSILRDVLIEDSTQIQFTALQYSLFTLVVVEVLGGIFFLLTSLYIIRDRANVDTAVSESNRANKPSLDQQSHHLENAQSSDD